MRPCYFDFEHTQMRRVRAIAMTRPIAWHRPPSPPPPRRNPPAHLWDVALALVAGWCRRVRGRRELAALDHRAQRDIGVTPSEVAHEVNKPFWKA
ncbi:MAG TPA: DUF1127 domain-containing protein [Stellaceae bacterium]|jgi:uncharacterized protein YjiS (DUF1127 family)|nr:DUF1127 domain-containing protein [Stellaceae bacterium]